MFLVCYTSRLSFLLTESKMAGPVTYASISHQNSALTFLETRMGSLYSKHLSSSIKKPIHGQKIKICFVNFLKFSIFTLWMQNLLCNLKKYNMQKNILHIQLVTRKLPKQISKFNRHMPRNQRRISVYYTTSITLHVYMLWSTGAPWGYFNK